MLKTAEPRTTIGDIKSKAAGLGAFGFVGVVIAQNLIRGSAAPSNGATAERVLAYYADHRAITFVLVATFVFSGAALATFLGGAMRRLTASGRAGWAHTGLVGAMAVIALFSILVACEQALSVIATHAQPSVAAVEALWALHNSVFTLLSLMIGIALVGLARAGVSAGITPPMFDRLAPIGAALLAVACMAGPATAAGDAMPASGLGLIGFAIWLGFLVATGRRLVRSES